MGSTIGKNVIWSFECFSTKYAERLGHRIGSDCYYQKDLKNIPSYGGIKSFHFIITTKEYSPW